MINVIERLLPDITLTLIALRWSMKKLAFFPNRVKWQIEKIKDKLEKNQME